jgi:hypothetical protein
MKDLKHYLALAAILSVGLGLFFLFDYNRGIQIGIVILLATLYVAWGALHHSLRKEFHLRILVEYLLVAILASVLVIFLLIRR